MFEYQCPGCGSAVKLGTAAEPGQQARCPVCKEQFTPRPAALAFKDDPPAAKPSAAVRAARPPAAKPVAAKPAVPRPAAAKPVAAQPAALPPAAPPPPPARHGGDDEDDVVAYGVVKESEEELKLIEKNKPKFTDVRDKFKRSARGPAQAMLVLPTNLLVGQGALTGLFGIGTVIVGLWPLIFTDAPPSDEDYAEALVTIFGGIVAFLWAALTLLGASKMQALESYAWALVGAVLGVLPLLAGIFAIVALRDPKVIAGFEEVEGALDDEDEDGGPGGGDAGEDDEDEDEDDEEEEDEDDEPPPKKKR